MGIWSGFFGATSIPLRSVVALPLFAFARVAAFLPAMFRSLKGLKPYLTLFPILLTTSFVYCRPGLYSAHALMPKEWPSLGEH